MRSIDNARGTAARDGISWTGRTRFAALAATLALLVGSFVAVSATTTTSEAQASNQSTPGANIVGWGDGSAAYGTSTMLTFVKAGETIVTAAAKVSAAGTTFTVRDQAGTVRALGTTFTATVDGIWTLTASNPAGQTGDRQYNWDVTVKAGATTKPGRTWSNSYRLHNSATSPTLQFWGVNDAGYVYKIDLKDYNGINSLIEANATGNPVSAADCAVPSYVSKHFADTSPQCGAPYRLFFEAPSADLPASAPSAGGVLTVKPAPLTVADLAITDLKFVPTAPTSASGTFTWTMPARFTGGYTLEIDADGNGNYTDAVDRVITRGANGSTASVSYAFDGKDGAGAAIADCRQINARIHYDKLGELHLQQFDVEGRSGLTLTRLNGPSAPSSTMYWDDRALPAVVNTTPVKDGRAGLNSAVAGGVHGWPYAGGSWGDNRMIDDWAYAPVDTTGQQIAIGGQCMTITKVSSAPASVKPGDTVTYTLTLKHTGTAPYTAANPARIEDDLSGILDDATYNNDASGGATVSGSLLKWSGALAVGATKTITYSVKVNSPATGDRIMGNTIVDPGGTSDCGPEGCTTTNPVQTFTVAKSASATTIAPGGIVTYTVLVKNTGQAAYTTAAPAKFSDNLSGVTDDAVYNGDVSTGGSVTGTTLSWSGALAIGETKTVTYSVTAKAPATGDKVMRNTVVPEGPTGSCDTVDGCATTTNVQTFTVAKSASATTVAPGGKITYTVLVKNTGQAAFTTAAPAKFSDDLSGVTDDATYNDDVSAGGSVTGNVLSWSGALAIGETKTVTYSVTAKAPATGDRIMSNTVVPEGPVGSCDTVGGCTTTTNVESFVVSKATSATSVTPGQKLSYTVSVTNTGTVAFTSGHPASFVDDLTAALDDAKYNDDVTNGATFAAKKLSWSGALAIGETKTIVYSVTVNSPATGDGRLVNAVVPGGSGDCLVAADCVTTTPVRSFHVVKSTTATSVIDGDTIPYTITITNTGQVDYTTTAPASFTDDLSDVLDDAVYNGDATNGATYAAPTLSWAGPLAIGQSVTIAYSATVTAPNTGDHRLDNTVVTPPGLGGNCLLDSGDLDCVAHVPGQSYTVSKTASKTTVLPGGVVVYTVTVINTGAVAYTTTSPASFADDLTAVLDDATYNGDASTGATVTGKTLGWSGALAVGASKTITYSVTANTPNTGDGTLINTVTATSRGGDCDPDEVCSTETGMRSYTVEKSSDPATVAPGGTVTYTVTVKNTGTIDYTVTEPASFTDDLSAVLDDAKYVVDPANELTKSGNILSWSGALAAGVTKVLSYTVTVDNPVLGDHVLTNAAIPGEPGGSCLVEDCPPAVTKVASFLVKKEVSATTAKAGDVISYTVTVENTGAVAYTTATPASFTDDLSDVLDDATYNGDASTGASVTGSVLSWSGPLAVGATTEVTYSVTVTAAGTGSHRLNNTVVPDPITGGCLVNCSTATDIQSFSVLKSASATTAIPGDTVVYTVTVTNTGTVDYPASAPAAFSDSLANVLDDATYNGDASNGAIVTGTTLSWSGALGAGASTTVVYSVTVNSPDLGNHRLDNVVVTPPGLGGDCEVAMENPDCVTVTPIASYTAVKAADATTVELGAVVTYTVTLTNTGTVAYTTATPASFTDDLTDVLDDATYNGDANSGATYAAPTLSWSGALPVGGSVIVTYSVTINDPATGDHRLDNVVVTPPEGGCALDAPNADCRASVPGPALHLVKTQSADTVIAGGTLSYTIAFTNTGETDYTVAKPASFTDDLSGVLDDAAYNGDVTGGATVVGSTLSWSGPLAVGVTKTVTYSVTVKKPNTGDHALVNRVLTPPNIASNCLELSVDPECVTRALVASFTTAKIVDVASAVQGSKVTYSVTVTNTGQTAYTVEKPASFTDDLSKVLDDAKYNGDASTGASVSGKTLSWSGPLAVGATTVVTYSVTIDAPSRGDHTLVNSVVPDPVTGGDCLVAADCTATTLVSSYSVVKKASADRVRAGDTVGYTITVTNTGLVDYTADEPASFTDDLSDVLKDADYRNDASNGAVYVTPVLSWSGPLAVGESATVTYSVVVKKGAISGTMRNVVVTPTESGSDCIVGSTDPNCSTGTLIDPPSLAFTGGDASLWASLSALLLASGAALVILARRRAAQRRA